MEHKEFGPHRKKVEKIAPRTGLCVHLNDDTIIQEKDAATTFTSTIIKAGLMNVRNLNLKFCGINIVSTTKDKKYGHAQREVHSLREPQGKLGSGQASQGLYVLTHSTKDKKKILDKISSALHLNWNVEIVQ